MGYPRFEQRFADPKEVDGIVAEMSIAQDKRRYMERLVEDMTKRLSACVDEGRRVCFNSYSLPTFKLYWRNAQNNENKAELTYNNYSTVCSPMELVIAENITQQIIAQHDHTVALYKAFDAPGTRPAYEDIRKHVASLGGLVLFKRPYIEITLPTGVPGERRTYTCTGFDADIVAIKRIIQTLKTSLYGVPAPENPLT